VEKASDSDTDSLFCELKRKKIREVILSMLGSPNIVTSEMAVMMRMTAMTSG
jgi:DNA polymerase elongation subunit (family B)